MAKRYQMPADGYIPVVKRGDFPHSCGVVQRIDDAAILSMYDNWKESGKPIPMGIDHFDGLSNEQRAGLKALDISLPSDAVAWINDLQIRGDTLYGKPVFNSENPAETGAYRMISPTFPTRGLEIVDREKKIVRPTILKNVSFTNEPNCRTIPMISNRNYEAFLMNNDTAGDVRGESIDLQNGGPGSGPRKAGDSTGNECSDAAWKKSATAWDSGKPEDHIAAAKAHDKAASERSEDRVAVLVHKDHADVHRAIAAKEPDAIKNRADLDNAADGNMKNDLSSFFAVLANRSTDQIEAAIENGDYPGHPFHGNQYAGGSGGSSEESSINADKRSKETRGLKEGTKEHSDAHSKAFHAHTHAATKAREEGNDEKADYHDAMAKFHQGKIGSHLTGETSPIAMKQKQGLDNKASDEMKNELATILNIKADAPEADFIAGVKTLANRAIESDKAALKAKVAEALTQYGPVIANREQAEAALTANFDGTIAAFKLIKPAPQSVADFQNRFKPGQLPDFGTDANALQGEIDAAITEIQNREKCGAQEAMRLLQEQNPALIAKACLPK